MKSCSPSFRVRSSYFVPALFGDLRGFAPAGSGKRPSAERGLAPCRHSQGGGTENDEPADPAVRGTPIRGRYTMTRPST